MAIRAIVVPLDKDLPSDKMRAILSQADCRAILCSKSVQAKIEELRSQPGMSVPCVVMDSPDFAALIAEGQERLDLGDSAYDDDEIDLRRSSKPSTALGSPCSTGTGSPNARRRSAATAIRFRIKAASVCRSCSKRSRS